MRKARGIDKTEGTKERIGVRGARANEKSKRKGDHLEGKGENRGN